MERGVPVIVLGVWICSIAQKQFDAAKMAMFGGIMERGSVSRLVSPTNPATGNASS